MENPTTVVIIGNNGAIAVSPDDFSFTFDFDSCSVAVSTSKMESAVPIQDMDNFDDREDDFTLDPMTNFFQEAVEKIRRGDSIVNLDYIFCMMRKKQEKEAEKEKEEEKEEESKVRTDWSGF